MNLVVSADLEEFRFFVSMWGPRSVERSPRSQPRPIPLGTLQTMMLFHLTSLLLLPSVHMPPSVRSQSLAVEQGFPAGAADCPIADDDAPTFECHTTSAVPFNRSDLVQDPNLIVPTTEGYEIAYRLWKEICPHVDDYTEEALARANARAGEELARRGKSLVDASAPQVYARLHHEKVLWETRQGLLRRLMEEKSRLETRRGQLVVLEQALERARRLGDPEGIAERERDLDALKASLAKEGLVPITLLTQRVTGAAIYWPEWIRRRMDTRASSGATAKQVARGRSPARRTRGALGTVSEPSLEQIGRVDVEQVGQQLAVVRNACSLIQEGIRRGAGSDREFELGRLTLKQCEGVLHAAEARDGARLLALQLVEAGDIWDESALGLASGKTSERSSIRIPGAKAEEAQRSAASTGVRGKTDEVAQSAAPSRARGVLDILDWEPKDLQAIEQLLSDRQMKLGRLLLEAEQASGGHALDFSEDQRRAVIELYHVVEPQLVIVGMLRRRWQDWKLTESTTLARSEEVRRSIRAIKLQGVPSQEALDLRQRELAQIEAERESQRYVVVRFACALPLFLDLRDNTPAFGEPATASIEEMKDRAGHLARELESGSRQDRRFWSLQRERALLDNITRLYEQGRIEEAQKEIDSFSARVWSKDIYQREVRKAR